MPSFEEVRKALTEQARRNVERGGATPGGAAKVVMLKREKWPLVTNYFPQLERLHRAFSQAADAVTAFTGAPICVENCGLCCTRATPTGTGVEAEYLVSWLLGHPDKIPPLLGRIRDWLTSKRRPWTYGTKLTPEQYERTVSKEFEAAATERCPFLGDDLRCQVHEARPLVCRAYGVTHMPNHWCKRPTGMNETDDSRAWWDPDTPEIPVRPMVNALRASAQEPQYSREGFIPTMVYERFRARELAGLLDDGKAPMAKVLVGWGGQQRALLWQEQLDAQWADQADAAIAEQVPLAEGENGVPVLRYGGRP